MEDAKKQLIEHLHQCRECLGRMKEHATDPIDRDVLTDAIAKVFEINAMINSQIHFSRPVVPQSPLGKVIGRLHGD